MFTNLLSHSNVLLSQKSGGTRVSKGCLKEQCASPAGKRCGFGALTVALAVRCGFGALTVALAVLDLYRPRHEMVVQLQCLPSIQIICWKQCIWLTRFR
jgi:hypothetical protein